MRDAYEACHGSEPAWGGWGRTPTAWQTWHDGLRLAQTWWMRNYDGNDLDLVEGYEYQSNATGTGIVDVGHYSWMHEVNARQVEFLGIATEAP